MISQIRSSFLLPGSQKKVSIGFDRVEAKASEYGIALDQVHGAEGFEVDRNFVALKQQGDFLFTSDEKLKIGVYVADCSPILVWGFRNAKPFVAGIHAGWRGTAKGVIETAFRKIGDASKVHA